MRVKLDENIGRRTADLFRAAGHDVSTIAEQEMAGASDDEVYSVCTAERRTIVTLDLDVANPHRYDPAPTAGIAVLRLPAAPGRGDLDAAARVLLAELIARDITGKLWVVRGNRIRQFEP